MSSHSTAARADLVTALQSVPATAPTLCEGWTALDLAAHVVARERRPDSGPGLMIPALAGWTERVRAGYARRPYPELIDLIAGGPPWTSPFAVPLVEAAVNLVEYEVHAEDVRRGQEGWQPRDLAPDRRDALWSALTRMGRMSFRRSPVALVLATPDGRRHAVGGEGPHVTLTGEPLELLLYASGRGTHAQVELAGAEDALTQFRTLRLGL